MAVRSRVRCEGVLGEVSGGTEEGGLGRKRGKQMRKKGTYRIIKAVLSFGN